MIDNSLIVATENAMFRRQCVQNARNYVRKKKVERVRNIMLGVVAVICVGIVGNSELEPVLAKSVKSQEQTYAKTCIITELDYSNDTVTCEDINGFQWSFKGCDDYDLEDMVSLVMNDKGTELIYDDEIISARYSGVLKFWSERGFN